MDGTWDVTPGEVLVHLFDPAGDRCTPTLRTVQQPPIPHLSTLAAPLACPGDHRAAQRLVQLALADLFAQLTPSAGSTWQTLENVRRWWPGRG